MVFGTKTDNRIWQLDISAQTIEILYDPLVSSSPVLTGVDNVTISSFGEILVEITIHVLGFGDGLGREDLAADYLVRPVDYRSVARSLSKESWPYKHSYEKNRRVRKKNWNSGNTRIP